MRAVDAVVLAGASNSGPLRECSNADYEAEIDVAGRPMVWYVVDALQRVESVQRIVVVGPVRRLTPLLSDLRCQIVERGETMVESLERGVSALGSPTAVLVVTGDIPLLTPEALVDFLAQCQTRQAELYYPVVAREVNERDYPGVQRTYVRLKDGVFTGGNVVLVRRTAMISEFKDVFAQAVALRKHPVKMCRLLGLTFLVRLVLGRLSIEEIEKRVGRLLNLNGACVISPYPEVGIDVDKPSDLELARRILSSR